MKHTFTTLAILAVAATTAVAADLPSKSSPSVSAPVFTQTNYFVGVNVGADTAHKQVYSAGITAGVNVLPYLAVEAAYDFGYKKDKVHGKHEKSNDFALNAIPQYKVFDTAFTAYGLGGVGYKFDNVVKNVAFYNVGGGLKYEFAKNVDLDARYRYSDAFDVKYKGPDQRYTLGASYKF